MSVSATTVALIGVRGFGHSYLEPLNGLAAAGMVRFAGGCDVNPEARADVPQGTRFYSDHRRLLTECAPDVTIVATPPHTHFDLAKDAIEAGSDVLLEKPPVVSVAQHEQLLDACRRRGRICQVGFQSLAGAAMQRLLDLVSTGQIGEVNDITVTGQWIRFDHYYQRSRWAGQRVVDGAVVADGVATNPLAHPVMNAIAVAQAADPQAVLQRMEVEAYRCRDIGTDDTMCARIRLRNGKRIHVALTLCAEHEVPPMVTVRGSDVLAELGRTGTALSLDGVAVDVPADLGRPLDNLLAHRRDPDRIPLLVPLGSTRAYSVFLEGMLNSGAPHRVPADFLEERHEDGSRRVVLRDVNAAVAEAGQKCALFSELGIPWSRPAVSVALTE